MFRPSASIYTKRGKLLQQKHAQTSSTVETASFQTEEIFRTDAVFLALCISLTAQSNATLFSQSERRHQPSSYTWRYKVNSSICLSPVHELLKHTLVNPLLTDVKLGSFVYSFCIDLLPLLLFTGSLQDMGDHVPPQLPIFCSSY